MEPGGGAFSSVQSIFQITEVMPSRLNMELGSCYLIVSQLAWLLGAELAESGLLVRRFLILNVSQCRFIFWFWRAVCWEQYWSRAVTSHFSWIALLRLKKRNKTLTFMIGHRKWTLVSPERTDVTWRSAGFLDREGHIWCFLFSFISFLRSRLELSGKHYGVAPGGWSLAVSVSVHSPHRDFRKTNGGSENVWGFTRIRTVFLSSPAHAMIFIQDGIFISALLRFIWKWQPMNDQ